VVGLELLPVPPRRVGAFHLAEREAGGGALALAGGGGADARGARAASGERRANLASEVAGAEEGGEEGRGSCAAARARRPSMAAGRCSPPCVACRRRGRGLCCCWGELDGVSLPAALLLVLVD
jgi:hypothetical protein